MVKITDEDKARRSQPEKDGWWQHSSGQGTSNAFGGNGGSERAWIGGS